MSPALEGRDRRSLGIRTAATAYRDHGFCPVPVAPRSKKPAISKWLEFQPTDEALAKHLSDNANVGVLTGLAGRVDIDIDHSLARAMAMFFLPPTQRRHGRSSAPGSHFWYQVASLMATTKYVDPVDNGMLVELRGVGAMTVVPPSRHPSGESYRWEEEGEFSEVSADLLSSQVAQLAAATLLARHWPKKGTAAS